MLREIWEENRPALAALAALVLALLSCLVVVPETEQAVVIRLGEPNRVINRYRPNVAFGATEKKQLTTDTVHVFNPYGATKAFGENLGRWFHDTYGLEFLAVRIGYFRGRYDDPALREAWLHRIWLGPKDCVTFFRLAVTAPHFGYGIVYACSRCPEDYLDLTSARKLLGYEPEETVPDAG